MRPASTGKPSRSREIEIDTGVIQFRQTKTLRGQHAIQSRWIHRTGRAVMAAKAF